VAQLFEEREAQGLTLGLRLAELSPDALLGFGVLALGMGGAVRRQRMTDFQTVALLKDYPNTTLFYGHIHQKRIDAQAGFTQFAAWGSGL